MKKMILASILFFELAAIVLSCYSPDLYKKMLVTSPQSSQAITTNG